MNIKVRRATVGDTKTVADFNAAIAEETEHRSLDRKLLVRGVRAILKDPTKGRYFIAEANGIPVGQIMFTYEWSDWRNGNFWWIQSVYVRGEYRRQGVFTSLYEHVENLAKKRKDVCGIRLYVERENERARTTYEKLGFHQAVYDMFEKDFVLG